MLQRERNALAEAGMEIPTEISFPSLPGSRLVSTPKSPISSSHGPLRRGNYCSSLGTRDLHLCCNYSCTSTAKG